MGRNTDYGNRRFGCPRLVVLLLTALLAGRAFSQELTAGVSPQIIEAGERATIRFELQYPYADQIYVEAPKLPDGIIYDSGPFLRPIRRDRTSVIEYTIRSSEAGRYILPSFIIHYPYGRVRSSPLALFVAGDMGNETGVPLSFFWKSPQGALFAGQAFPISLWADLITEPPEDVRVEVNTPKEVMLRRMEELPIPEPLETANMKLYRVPLARYMVHPAEAGEFIIPGGTLTLSGRKEEIPELRIAIRPIPNAVQADTAGTGDLEFSAEIDESDSGGVNVIRVILSYSGTGNFPLIRYPSIITEGLVQIHSTEKQEFTPVLEYPYGYRGYKRRVITYRREPDTRAQLRIGEAVIFNPSTLRLEAFPKRGYAFKAYEAPLDGAEETESEEYELFPLPERAGDMTVRMMYRKPLAYLLYLPPVFLIFFRGIRRKKTPLQLVGLVLLFFGCSAAEVSVPLPEEKDGNRIYEEAYRYYENGDFGESLLRLRQLHRLKPMNREIISVIGIVEQAAGVNHQVQAGIRLHPDLFYWSVLGILYISGGVIWFFNNNYKRFLLLFFSLLIVTLVTVPVSTGFPPIIVIGTDSELRVIPSVRGTVKLKLAEGTVLEIEEKWDDFYQVVTGDGIIGWVANSDVLVQE